MENLEELFEMKMTDIMHTFFLFKCHLPLHYKSESLVDVKADTCSWTKQTTIIFTYNGLYRTFIIMKMHGLWKLGISYCLHKGID